MRANRTVAVAALGLVAVLGLAACGSGGGGATGSAPAVADQRAADAGTQGQAAEAPAQAGGGQAGGGQTNPRQPGEGTAVSDAGQQVPAGQRAVVRSAQLSIEVPDVYQAARRTADVGARFGGYVSDERTEARASAIELKVAADRLDDALAALSEVGTRVINRSQQAKDVTDQLVDLQSRVASQRASVARVRALFDRAGGIAETVQIEAELARRQADLESLEQRAAALGNQVELATITVRISGPGPAAADEPDSTGFIDGLGAGWRAFLASANVLLTVFGALLPFLVALAVPTAVAVWAVRRRRPPTRPAPAAQAAHAVPGPPAGS